MTGFATTDGPLGAASSHALVYRDDHETSLTLMVLGGVIAACAGAQLASSGGGPSEFADLLTPPLLAIAFAALWLTFWRRAAVRGMRRPPGFGIAAVIALAPMLLFPVAIIAGPFVGFGVGLLVAGLKLGNRLFTYWAVAVGGIGVFEGFFGITNRLPFAIWADWEHYAIYLFLGVLTISAGLIIHTREGTAAQS